MGPGWNELVRWATAELRRGGASRPEVEALWIAEEATGLSAADVLAETTEPTTSAVARFHEMVSRRAAGEPIQYVLGHWPFRGLDLMVDRRVLIPRPETEVLVDAVLRELRALDEELLEDPAPAGRRSPAEKLVADLGTGSGAIALALVCEEPTVRVWATDIDGDALAVARANLAGAGMPAARVRLSQGSWYSALPAALEGRFHVVVSNPPYVAAEEVLPTSVAAWEPRHALVAGSRGTEAIEEVLGGAPRWLCRRGRVVVEIAPHQEAQVVRLAETVSLEVLDVVPDQAGRSRVLVAVRRA
ncbi:MAG: release factor glutamine methyltransferase [Acidimicrobiales bacterium]|nr:MAG: release factor glutamine methyltransferase [Acidimicrobiales bacterium]